MFGFFQGSLNSGDWARIGREPTRKKDKITKARRIMFDIDEGGGIMENTCKSLYDSRNEQIRESHLRARCRPDGPRCECDSNHRGPSSFLRFDNFNESFCALYFFDNLSDLLQESFVIYLLEISCKT